MRTIYIVCVLILIGCSNNERNTNNVIFSLRPAPDDYIVEIKYHSNGVSNKKDIKLASNENCTVENNANVIIVKKWGRPDINNGLEYIEKFTIDNLIGISSYDKGDYDRNKKKSAQQDDAPEPATVCFGAFQNPPAPAR